jgi:hypothetical protein
VCSTAYVRRDQSKSIISVRRNVQQRRGGGVAGAQRRAGEGGRVRARPGAGVPDPAQLVRRLHPGQDGGGRQVPADAEHERPPRAVLVLGRPRRHPRRRRVAFAGESRRGGTGRAISSWFR